MSPPAQPRRVALFGGTFDPPHVGHLFAVTDAAEQLGLELVLWTPVATQPLKGGSHATAEDRLRMVEMTVAGHPAFRADASEVRRAGLSFTVDTLGELHGLHPGAELFLLVGEDSWRTFGEWREPERIRELARVAILRRTAPPPSPAEAVKEPGGDAPRWLTTRRVDVSATEIRERVRAGLPIRGFVVEAVERYIDERRLYR